MAHVSDHSKHHQVYTDFTLKENAITLSCHLSICGITRVYEKILFFFWYYNPWWIVSRRQLPSMFWVLQLTYPFPYIANHCLCWVVSIVSIWFQASEGSQDTYFLLGGVVSLMPNPQPRGPGSLMPNPQPRGPGSLMPNSQPRGPGSLMPNSQPRGPGYPI